MPDIPSIAMDLALLRALDTAERAERAWQPDPRRTLASNVTERLNLRLDRLEVEWAITDLIKLVGPIESADGKTIFDIDHDDNLVRITRRMQLAIWAPAPEAEAAEVA